MGRSFIKAVLNSSRNIHPDDNSPEAQRARQIRSFGDLDGAEFAARIGIEKDGQGEYRNIIRLVMEPDHKEYAELMQAKLQRDGGMGGGSGGALDRIEPLGPLLAAVRQHLCPCDRNCPALQSFATNMSGKDWLPSPPCTFFFRIDNLGFFDGAGASNSNSCQSRPSAHGIDCPCSRGRIGACSFAIADGALSGSLAWSSTPGLAPGAK